jgi:uncharacterized membrane protein (Fun14 family)
MREVPSDILRVHALDTSGLVSLIVTQVGFGGTLGFLLGYGLKKVAAIVLKIAALISGLFMLALTWLASTGVITVNFKTFSSVIENTFTNSIAGLVGSVTLLAEVLPISGSFGVGFYLGAKKG